jgi:hypothetical protein
MTIQGKETRSHAVHIDIAENDPERATSATPEYYLRRGNINLMTPGRSNYRQRLVWHFSHCQFRTFIHAVTLDLPHDLGAR